MIAEDFITINGALPNIVTGLEGNDWRNDGSVTKNYISSSTPLQ